MSNKKRQQKMKQESGVDNRPTQLLNPTGIEGGIHNGQVLKYPPSVTSREIFHHLIPIIIIRYQNISLDVTGG